MSDKTPELSSTPHPLGKPGGPGLFHVRGLSLPPYIENIAAALHKTNPDLSRCISLAIGAVKRWASGAGKVSPEVRAASQKALAQWEAAKAKAHASSGKSGKRDKVAASHVLDRSAFREGLALAGRHHAGPQRYRHGWIPVDGGGSPKHGKPERFAEGAADSKRPPLDPQHVSDVKDRLDELAKHAPEIARRQRALLNDLHKQGKLTSERLRSAKSGIDRLIVNHRKNKPSTDPGLVAISHDRGPDALALATRPRRSSRMATTPMTDSGSGPNTTKNSSSKKPTDAKAAAKAAGNSADEDKVKAAAKALMARGWPLPKAMKAAKELVAKQKSSATQDAKAS